MPEQPTAPRMAAPYRPHLCGGCREVGVSTLIDGIWSHRWASGKITGCLATNLCPTCFGAGTAEAAASVPAPEQEEAVRRGIDEWYATDHPGLDEHEWRSGLADSIRAALNNRPPAQFNPYAHGGSLHKACDESCPPATPPPVPVPACTCHVRFPNCSVHGAVPAAPPLDVERLAWALDRLGIEADRMGIPARRADAYRELAAQVAAEYARLSHQSEDA